MAIITHAHRDHAIDGCQRYLTAQDGLELLQRRAGLAAAIDTVPYGEVISLNGVRVSLHPAGHVLGSAQVRIEQKRCVTVVSGDYKVDPDPTRRAVTDRESPFDFRGWRAGGATRSRRMPIRSK